MATYKRIDGDYNITTVNSNDYVNITTHTVKVYGNLDVVGNLTYIETTELRVDDPFITVAANNNGTLGTAAFQNQGLIAQTSATTFAGIRFDNLANTWQISSDVYANGDPIASYANLVAGSGATPPGGADTDVQFNDGGNFGGTGNLTFDKTANKLTLLGHQVYGNIGAAPSPVANAVAVYNNAVGGGGTGLYVKSAAVNDELISKTQAIVYSLIF